ncbi:MAG: type I glutamate--ammonia ligase [Rickettsiaceae bacterium H1]|nr:type I glutamate--ammonia ligase [Rickettsiaceae bacterium H1]
MFQSLSELYKHIKADEVKFIDFRFTDSIGKSHHITWHADSLNDELFDKGISFDGSSIRGWKLIEKSDMLIKPDITMAFTDPFTAQNTLVIFCNIVDTETNSLYDRDPRSTAKRALEHMRKTGIADKAYFGLEMEFFIFDDVRFSVKDNAAFFELDSIEGRYNSGRKYEYGNHGHRPGIKGGYSPIQPVDNLHDIRSEILDTLATIGIKPLLHHHEVAPSQCEIGFEYGELIQAADNMQKCKYVVMNVAGSYGKSATFMPKPIFNDNGNGMHCHQSLWKDGKNLFAENENKVSQLCKYYIGGIIKHGKALNAFTNPTTNSYKRLVPGYEAPTRLAYSSCNRSAAIRIPFTGSYGPNSARIEVRFPDPSANPYYCVVAQLMAGLDGIMNKIDPGKESLTNLYEDKTLNDKIPAVSSSLEEALINLDKDREFLTRGSVFTDEQINAYVKLKKEEVREINLVPNPSEFVKYYSL